MMCHTDSNISILLISKAGHLTKTMNYLINSGINFGCCDIKKIVFGLENISFEAST